MKKSILIQMISYLLLIISCQKHTNLRQPELLEFLKIDTNIENVIRMDDLYFTSDYNLSFEKNDDIKLKYNQKTKELKLFPKENFFGLTFINFNIDDSKLVLPVIVKSKVAVTFNYTPKKRIDNVYIMGSFNTWNRNSDEMTDPDGDNTYSKTVLLDDGVYEYQIVAGGSEFPDPTNPEKIDNGFGNFNSLIRVKSPLKAESPNLYFIQDKTENNIKLHIEAPQPVTELQFHILKNNKLLLKSEYQIVKNMLIIPLKPSYNTNTLTVIRAVATFRNYPGNIITVWTKNGKVINNHTDYIWQDAIIYSIMTDRFCNGDRTNDNPLNHPELHKAANFNGGDFKGITQKIQEGYFKNLGINTIWISPVNKTTNNAFQEFPPPHRYYTGYHGYWPVSSTETEPRFGSMDEFKNMVDIAQNNNIKILLDFVSNHTHQEHHYFREHRNWFGTYNLPDGRKNMRLWNEFRLTTWFDTFLPSFDFINSDDALNTMIDNAAWWIEETNIDGFRHDATKHVPYKFWRSLTQRIKSDINPKKDANCYQIGETFGSNQLIKSYVNNGMLDSQFNFGLFFTQRRVFAEKKGSLLDVKLSLEKGLEVFGYNHVMGNIFDSHDQVRMMSLLEGDLTLSDNGSEKAWELPAIKVDKISTYNKQQALMTFILTIPGVPIIYYGDEFGMTGANDPDNRRMMRFDAELNINEKKQLQIISEIVQVRKNHAALRRGDYLPLFCDDNVFIYSRGDTSERLIIAINKNNNKELITLDIPDWITASTLKSLLNTNNLTVKNNTLKLELTAYSGNIWICK